MKESEEFADRAVSNNTHVYPHNQYCSVSHCRTSTLSFCCVSNITDSTVLINYPARPTEEYSDFENSNIRYEISFDTWEKERIERQSSALCLSVDWAGYSQIIRGTYSCEAVDTDLATPQIFNIGVFSIYGKM